MQQALFPLHLVTVGVSVAWLFRLVNHNNPPPKPKAAGEPRDAAAAGETSLDADLERSATQWLARSGGGPQSPAFAEHTSSSYAELELLAEGDFVYLRSGSSVLAALVPPVRHLTLQPLQLAKGRPGSVPTAPLEAISVWLVRRCKQEIMFELLGPHDRRHILEADPGAPHGVALAGGSPGKRGRWLITPQGLASVRWPSHVLPLQVVTVQLFDARAVRTVRDGLGQKLAELGAKLRHGEAARSQAEAEQAKAEAELQRVRNETESQIAELRAQLEAAVIARHAAEREAAALQGMKADEGARTKMAQARAAQAESEAQLAGATVRRQEQQIQGLLAEHAEELRTLQQELQIAREANEGLKRAMREQVLSLQGALELRDARILELEEENDRMDTVLQVIQAQLGGGFSVPERRESGAGGAAPEVEGRAAANTRAEKAGSPADKADAASRAEADDTGSREPGQEPSLAAIVEAPVASQEPEQWPSLPAGPAVAEDPPLWRSLLDLTGDLSVTALKESLAISRRNTVEDAPTPSVAWEPQLPLPPPQRQQSADGANGTTRAGSAAPTSPERGGSAVCSTSAGARAPASAWGSGGGEGSGGGATVEDEEEFVSAAARMSGYVRLSGGATATPLRQQQPQVPGATGGDVGLPSAARAGADAAARRGSSGEDHAATLLFDGAALSGADALAALAAAPGCSAAELEYGMEATLTLDSLRRRMRQLEAERQRLELLRVSLEESLPWRAGMSAGGGDDASRVAVMRPCGGGGAVGAGLGLAAAATGGDMLGQGQLVGMVTGKMTRACGQYSQSNLRQRQLGGSERDSERDQQGKSGQPTGLEEQVVAQRLRQRAQCPWGNPDRTRAAGAVDSPVGGRQQQQQQQQRKTDGGGVSTRSPVLACRPLLASAGGGVAVACSASPAASPTSSARIRCITDQLLSHSSSSSGEARVTLLLVDGAAAAGPVLPSSGDGASSSGDGGIVANELDAEDSLTFSCCSSDVRSGDSTTSQQGDAHAACDAAAPVAADGAFIFGDPAGGDGMAVPAVAEGQAADPDGPFPAPPAPLVTGTVGAPSALRLPGLAIDGRPAPRVEVPHGLYESIDGLCNLGSTRALPTARGAGWQTARKVAHSRQPSAGVVAAEAMLPPLAAAAVETPRGAPACSSGRPLSHRPVAAEAAAAGGMTPPESMVGGVATPKSCASTTTCGGGDFGLMDDDAIVHCDDQEPPSPPPAMLLGPLDQLRGAAAALAAATAASMDGGVVRMGGRVMAALEEDDEAY